MWKVSMHRLQELVRLHRLGEGPRSVARQLKMSPNTEREYRNALKAAGLLVGDADALPELEVLKLAIETHKPAKPPPQHASSVERWREHVEALVAGGGAPKAIFDRLRLEHEEFAGSLSAIKRMVAAIVKERGVRADDVAIPVDTLPGQVAQVDFGAVGLAEWTTGKRRDPFQGVTRRYSALRRFAPAFLSALEFNAAGDSPVPSLDALAVLRELNDERRRKLPDDAPTEFVRKRLRPYMDVDGETDRRAWECALLFQLREDVRAGNITVGGSKRFAPIDDFLMPQEQWSSLRARPSLQDRVRPAVHVRA